MKIIWEESDEIIKENYENRKKHFLNNKHLRKPSNVSEDEAFLLSAIASY